MLALAHGVQSHSGMHVVGYPDGDGIDLVTHFFEQFSVVLKDWGVGVQFAGLFGASEVHVAKGDVFSLRMAGHLADVAPTTALGADCCEL
jgi:hypothetical protein